MKKILYVIMILSLVGNAYSIESFRLRNNETQVKFSIAAQKFKKLNDRLSQKWFFQTYSQPTSMIYEASKKVFYVTADRNLLCIDENSGKLLWSRYGNYLLKDVHRNGTILVKLDNHLLQALDPQGKFLWEQPYPKNGLLSNSKLVYGLYWKSYTDPYELIAYDWSGKQQWSILTKANTIEGYQKDTLYLKGWSTVIALNAGKGNVLWELNLTKKEDQEDVFVNYFEIAENGILYAITRPTLETNRLYAISEEGKIKWDYEIPNYSMPEILYANNDGVALLADKQQKGQAVFIVFLTADGQQRKVYHLPYSVRGYHYEPQKGLFLQTFAHEFFVLDNVGNEKWHIQLPNVIYWYSLQEQLYIAYKSKDSNVIQAFDFTTGKSEKIYETTKDDILRMRFNNNNLYYMTENGIGVFNFQ